MKTKVALIYSKLNFVSLNTDEAEIRVNISYSCSVKIVVQENETSMVRDILSQFQTTHLQIRILLTKLLIQ